MTSVMHRDPGRRSETVALGLLAASCLLPTAAYAQDPVWPARPVSIVVGTPAGGAVDAYARVLAQHLGKVTGATFVVENKPGANGNISAEYVLKSAPDGHALWIGTQSMVTINPSAYPSLRRHVPGSITAAAGKVQADPEYRAKLEAQGFDVPTMHGEAFARGIAAESRR
ncbi:MAG: hypothetical protein KJZ98_10150 [Burkholderiaceae bacterium]|jgi:tripartite-type tricarboxylate transporter receptor subunit TctC|nr:hypothetical protein [Burkholderiaceae bacterium]MEB2352941.1 tripartite tricarboxylate transporter substrate-binding protein [Burkholderiaceae bacterium]